MITLLYVGAECFEAFRYVMAGFAWLVLFHPWETLALATGFLSLGLLNEIE